MNFRFGLALLATLIIGSSAPPAFAGGAPGCPASTDGNFTVCIPDQSSDNPIIVPANKTIEKRYTQMIDLVFRICQKEHTLLAAYNSANDVHWFERFKRKLDRLLIRRGHTPSPSYYRFRTGTFKLSGHPAVSLHPVCGNG